MKRVTAGLAPLLLAALVAGCGESTPTTACSPRGSEITICLNGKPLDFSAAQHQPHIHETGNLYAPAIVLAQALHVPAQVDAQHLSVTVNGQAIKAVATQRFKGIHKHDDEVFVPIREFAQAAGITLNIQTDGRTAGFAK